MKILILCGLPGSGKTHFANELMAGYNSYYSKYRIIDVDHYVEKHKKNADILAFIKSQIKSYASLTRDLILDGLFLNQDTYEKIVSLFPDKYQYEFHYWYPDIETCIYNDKNRRNETSEHTIKNIIFEKPDIQKLKLINKNIIIKEHSVKRKPDYKFFMEENNMDSNKKFVESDSWCMGGQRNDCYGGTYSYHPDPQPRTIEILRDLLKKIAPKITFLEYEDLVEECTEIVEKDDSDYYGGSVRYACYKINMELLHDKLQEMGYIKENN